MSRPLPTAVRSVVVPPATLSRPLARLPVLVSRAVDWAALARMLSGTAPKVWRFLFLMV